MAFTEIDRSLLTRCLTNQAGAWRDFVDRFIGLFVHVVNHAAQARSVQVTPDLVDDLCAEVFLKLVENDYAILRKFRGQSSLATYLTVVARRVVVNEIAKRRMAEAMGHVTQHTVAPQAHAETTSPERRIESKEEVERLLKGLSTQEADVVRRFHLQGQPYREISRELRIPENSVGAILSRARQRLHERAVKS